MHNMNSSTKNCSICDAKVSDNFGDHIGSNWCILAIWRHRAKVPSFDGVIRGATIWSKEKCKSRTKLLYPDILAFAEKCIVHYGSLL